MTAVLPVSPLMGSFGHAEGHMRQKLTDIGAWTGLQSLWVVVVAIVFAMAVDLGTASAQTSAPQIVRPASNNTSIVTSGSGQYYFEFRSRQAWDYGHTFVVFGRVGEPPSKKNVAGLSPKGDDPQMWLMGHYVPVPSDTGWTDGDLEDKYVTSRYRVLVSKEQYDRTVAYIRQLQAKSTTWSVELYNCNAFVADIAKFMGLKAPASTWIYPKVFVSNMRKINTGHPEAAEELVSENVKEMSNPTRDGRAMINAGLIRPDSAPAGSASPPHVTIGAVRVTNRGANSAVASEPHTP
ncbi:MAG TPA: hypothetical protein VGZ89_02035 [Xanthobacteraceae bacterium]|jgi:hypothetical protein|nr:hypothetical protein [Xanthobacteraceae bacterium]